MEEKKPLERVIPAAPTFSEAPASFNFPVEFQTDDGLKWTAGLTIRGNTGPEAIERLLEAIKYGAARCRMGVVKTPQAQPAPAQRQAEAAADFSLDRLPPAPGEPQRAPADRPVSPPAGSSVIYATQLEIAPRPDGKVKLGWFAAGHRFPDISKVTTVEAATDLLLSTGEAWRSTDLTKAGMFNVRHAITWHPGKPKAQGHGNYQDIDSVSVY